jgi:chemotaxis protein methyltransferase CheR
MKNILPDEAKLLSRYIQEMSGISVDQSKNYLLETRLSGLLEEFKLESYRALYERARSDPKKTLETRIIDAISTNETLFFRDGSPFEVLRHKILPDLIDARSGRTSGSLPVPIRIWSAACSTGQEVYSIAMVLKELLGDLRKYSIRLLGTDISDAAISQASYGAYSKFELDRGLPQDKLQRYFSPNGAGWKIKDDIRAMAIFKRMNLLLPFSGVGRFDIVLCRNVAIYFQPEDRKKLFDKIADILEPDGYLIIGSTESLTGVSPRFEPKRHVRSIYYQLKG